LLASHRLGSTQGLSPAADQAIRPTSPPCPTIPIASLVVQRSVLVVALVKTTANSVLFVVNIPIDQGPKDIQKPLIVPATVFLGINDHSLQGTKTPSDQGQWIIKVLPETCH